MTWEGPGRLAIPLEGYHLPDKHGQHRGPEGREHSSPDEDKARS
jgi:hypothetical protein